MDGVRKERGRRKAWRCAFLFFLTHPSPPTPHTTIAGSMNMSYDSSNLTTPDIKWLGVRPSDLDKFHIPAQCRLAMTDDDVKTGKRLMEEDFIKANPEWVKELELMTQTKVKAEIQALSSFGFQYLSEVYLPLKLQEGGWI